MNPDEFRRPPGQLLRSLQGHWTFNPSPLPPPIIWSPELIAALSDADRSLGELAGLGRSLPNPHLLVRPFIRREAVLSSRIEGTHASLSDLYAYEAVQLSFLEDVADVHEVQNYVHALEYGLERLQAFPMSLRLICEIHSRLMEGVRGERLSPGEFRKGQNFIGPPGSAIETATYIPPSVQEMRVALSDLEKYLHVLSDLPPLVRIGLIHYQFEAIHPFADGNGRIGRLLITLFLCAWNLLPQPLLYLSAFFEANRQAYYDLLLGVSQNSLWEDGLTFFLKGVSIQSRDATRRIQRLQDLREEYYARFQTGRASARLLKVVDLLFEQPVVTMRQVEAALDANYQAARRYVQQLEQAGALREITGHARNRMYRADEILQAIEEPLDQPVK